MDLNININFGGASGVGGPSGTDGGQSKSLADIGKALESNDPATQQDALKDLLKMLAEMLKADDKKPPEDQMDPEDKKKLQDALNSLKKDGAKGDQAGNLVSQVLQALGVPQGVADAIGSAVSQSGGDSDSDSDGGGGIE